MHFSSGNHRGDFWSRNFPNRDVATNGGTSLRTPKWNRTSDTSHYRARSHSTGICGSSCHRISSRDEDLREYPSHRPHPNPKRFFTPARSTRLKPRSSQRIPAGKKRMSRHFRSVPEPKIPRRVLESILRALQETVAFIFSTRLPGGEIDATLVFSSLLLLFVNFAA